MPRLQRSSSSARTSTRSSGQRLLLAGAALLLGLLAWYVAERRGWPTRTRNGLNGLFVGLSGVTLLGYPRSRPSKSVEEDHRKRDGQVT